MPDLLVYLRTGVALVMAVMSLAAFFTMAADKGAAKKQRRRVPEKTLFALALLGGGVGATLGMRAFRHKTRHRYFAWGMPLIALVQVVLLAWLIYAA